MAHICCKYYYYILTGVPGKPGIPVIPARPSPFSPFCLIKTSVFFLTESFWEDLGHTHTCTRTHTHTEQH